ncbi:hypothetical protein [Mesorhizobium sp. M1136]|uniref:hypothetical protein n=1 Tax=Mesorhizobium sp. M1136 TaxID=2957059 RepID=UPI00333708BF
MLLAQMELQPEDLEADAGEGELASEMAARRLRRSAMTFLLKSTSQLWPSSRLL